MDWSQSYSSERKHITVDKPFRNALVIGLLIAGALYLFFHQ